VAMIKRVRHEFGRLDILVNDAAFQMSLESIEEISTEEFDRVFKTNVFAMFWLCRAGLPQMKVGSVVINTASIQAYDPSPTLLAYAATKAAIVNFTKALSQTAMKRSVRVNAVAPGPVWTPLIPSTMPESTVKEFGADTAFGRPAQPVELAPLFVFLASNEARFVTGEVYARLAGKRPFEFHLAGRVQGQRLLRGGGMPVPEPEDVTVRIPSTNTDGEHDQVRNSTTETRSLRQRAARFQRHTSAPPRTLSNGTTTTLPRTAAVAFALQSRRRYPWLNPETCGSGSRHRLGGRARQVRTRTTATSSVSATARRLATTRATTKSPWS
jgi:Enoyl-(Acyl carrier protein) reductase